MISTKPLHLLSMPFLRVLSGWFLSYAAPRLRNLGWAGRSSENPHLRRAITTPLTLCLDYKIITREGGSRGRQVFPGGQEQPRTCCSTLTWLQRVGTDMENCPGAT